MIYNYLRLLNDIDTYWYHLRVCVLKTVMSVRNKFRIIIFKNHYHHITAKSLPNFHFRNQGSYVVFGDFSSSTSSTTHVQSNFCGIFTHDPYGIVLIKLCTPVAFNSQVAPACVQTSPNAIDDYRMLDGETESKCRIFGWGLTTSEGKWNRWNGEEMLIQMVYKII